MQTMEAAARHLLCDLEYYVTETELGWALIMRRGAQLSLTQHFASIGAAVTHGLDILRQVESRWPQPAES